MVLQFIEFSSRRCNSAFLYCAFYILIPVISYSQTLLCSKDAIDVYYTTDKINVGATDDEWKISLSIRNTGTTDLYFATPVPSIEEMKWGATISKSFLSVKVENAVGVLVNRPFKVNGKSTFHMTTNATAIMKVGVVTLAENFTARIRKHEMPVCTCEFTVPLQPLDSMKLVGSKKK